MILLPDPTFRDRVYKYCAPSKTSLDNEMGELSQGELISIQLGWTMERITLTRLWMIFNDNKLPRPDDYKAFRKKRSEYWMRRSARIFKDER